MSKDTVLAPDRFSFFRSYKSAIDKLTEPADKVAIYDAIAAYALDREELPLSGSPAIIFELVKPVIDKAWRDFDNGCKGAEYGKKGGNPNFQKGRRNPYYQDREDNPLHNPPDNPGIGIGVGKDKDIGGVGGRRFTPPTLSEIESYVREKGYGVDAGAFVDFYESKGWMIGKNRMKEWRAAVRTWNSKDKLNTTQNHETPILNI